jgi:hypothetical protein
VGDDAASPARRAELDGQIDEARAACDAGDYERAEDLISGLSHCGDLSDSQSSAVIELKATVFKARFGAGRRGSRP